MQTGKVDTTAVIYPCAKLGKGVVVEPLCIIGLADRFHDELPCVIGQNSFIGSRSTIYCGVVSGDNLDISDQTTIFYDNQFGNNCRIGPKAVIKNGCQFGDNIRLNALVFLERVDMGSNIFVGPGTVFTDDLHPPCPKYLDCAKKTKVESYVSVGANVTIAPGITIGHHSQIYAGAVVIADVEPYSVIAGNPARRIKDFRKLVCKPGHYSRPFEWWDE